MEGGVLHKGWKRKGKWRVVDDQEELASYVPLECQSVEMNIRIRRRRIIHQCLLLSQFYSDIYKLLLKNAVPDPYTARVSAVAATAERSTYSVLYQQTPPKRVKIWFSWSIFVYMTTKCNIIDTFAWKFRSSDSKRKHLRNILTKNLIHLPALDAKQSLFFHFPQWTLLIVTRSGVAVLVHSRCFL